jgi:hypothetical protein
MMSALRDSLREPPENVIALAQLWRTQVGQWHASVATALPQNYLSALENILSRLESASSFSEESCSFSQKDLLDALGVWLDRVQRLTLPSGTHEPTS